MRQVPYHASIGNSRVISLTLSPCKTLVYKADWLSLQPHSKQVTLCILQY